MRVGREVKVREAFFHAHENDLDPPEERPVPEHRADKRLTLDCLLGFIDLQVTTPDIASGGTPSQAIFDPAPILCQVVIAVEETGTLPLASRKNVGKVALPDVATWLAARLQAWHHDRRREAIRTRGSRPGSAPALTSASASASQSGSRSTRTLQRQSSRITRGPSQTFMMAYQKYADIFPKDFARRQPVATGGVFVEGEAWVGADRVADANEYSCT